MVLLAADNSMFLATGMSPLPVLSTTLFDSACVFALTLSPLLPPSLDSVWPVIKWACSQTWLFGGDRCIIIERHVHKVKRGKRFNKWPGDQSGPAFGPTRGAWRSQPQLCTATCWAAPVHAAPAAWPGPAIITVRSSCCECMSEQIT